MSDDEELPPSKLGTKEHWDMVYDRENRVFEDVGDEGEVWFGESAVDKMRAWADKNLPRRTATSSPLRVLECGSGNGTLLLSFLTSPGDEPQSFHLTGIDYSSGAAKLGASIEASRRENLEDELDEDEEVMNEATCEWRVGDLLRDDIPETWDLVMDKGTFDALALSQEPVEESGGQLPSRVYPERIARLVKPGGFFLITSCNFTEEEVKKRYTAPGVPFTFHSSVPHRSFSFGGKTGQTVCTVAFTRNEDASAAATAPADPLYACVDCGGTKTEVVIASKQGIVARALGGTGNMAEVGLQQSFETIKKTVVEALVSIGHAAAVDTNGAASNGSKTPEFCPVLLADIWVGIAGCDTPLDQANMSGLLTPFFRRPVAVYNDALLLGGALLQAGANWGIALIAGTGSIAVAMDVDPATGALVQLARRGGHGYILGEEGSAYDVGRCALRCAVDAFDAGTEAPDGLAASLRVHFGVEETGELLAKVHHLDNALPAIDASNQQKLRISSAARCVLEAFTASPPDPLAVQAVGLTLGPLAKSVVDLVRQVERMPLPNGEPRVLKDAMLVAGGGVIRQDAYRAAFLEECSRQGAGFGKVAVVEDVAGTAALGLVQRAEGGQ